MSAIKYRQFRPSRVSEKRFTMRLEINSEWFAIEREIWVSFLLITDPLNRLTAFTLILSQNFGGKLIELIVDFFLIVSNSYIRANHWSRLRCHQCLRITSIMSTVLMVLKCNRCQVSRVVSPQHNCLSRRPPTQWLYPSVPYHLRWHPFIPIIYLWISQ